MKKLLILTTFLSSLIMTSVANAEWTKLSKDTNGNTFYVDLERIKKHDGKVYFWFLADMLKPSQTGTISYIAYSEAECGRFRWKDLTFQYYNSPMASGKISSSRNSPDKDWRYPNPNSVYEFTLNVVCNHKSMQ